jgi:RNA polymerase sigma-32 factor
MTTLPTGYFQSGADDLKAYMRKIQDYPLLEPEEEFTLAKKWVETQDARAAQKLITSHLRLVAKIASGYRGYGLPISELIAEGNIGIMQAMKKFDPAKGNRFSTYAMWWIKAAMQDYILRSWSLVKIGTTAAQKKLFFNLRRLKHELSAAEHKNKHNSDEKRRLISEELGVKEDEVQSMEQRLFGSDYSLNASVGGDGETLEWQDWLVDTQESQEEKAIKKDTSSKQTELLEESLQKLTPRELQIIQARRLKDPPLTLEALAKELSVSKERVRQLENRAFSKMQKYMMIHAEKYGW